MTRIGVGHRPELALWIDSRPPEIGCLEIVAEHFADPKRFWRLRTIAETYPLSLHSLGLSLGTPGPLDHEALTRLVEIVAVAEPLWVSEHIGFCRTAEVDLGHFNPVSPTRESIRVIADHAREVVEACGRPLILENITANRTIPGELLETDFLNRLSEESGCGLLLDVTNLFVNARNFGFDPYTWLRDIDPHPCHQSVRQRPQLRLRPLHLASRHRSVSSSFTWSATPIGAIAGTTSMRRRSRTICGK